MTPSQPEAQAQSNLKAEPDPPSLPVPRAGLAATRLGPGYHWQVGATPASPSQLQLEVEARVGAPGGVPSHANAQESPSQAEHALSELKFTSHDHGTSTGGTQETGDSADAASPQLGDSLDTDPTYHRRRSGSGSGYPSATGSGSLRNQRRPTTTAGDDALALVASTGILSGQTGGGTARGRQDVPQAVPVSRTGGGGAVAATSAGGDTTGTSVGSAGT